MRWNGKAVTAVATCTFLLTACGSEGGDGGATISPTPVTETQSVGTIVPSSTQNVLRGLDLGLRSVGGRDFHEQPSTRLFKQTQITNLAASVATFHSALAARRADIAAPRAALPCPNGEAVTIETAFGVMTPFTDCNQRIDENGDGVDDIEVSLSGSVNFSVFNADFTLTLTDFRTQVIRLADGSLLEEEVLNLTMTGTVESTTVCLENEVPDSFTIVINGTFSRMVDENADNVLDEDVSGNFKDFTIALMISSFDLSSCVPMAFDAAESGMLDLMDSIETSNSFTLSIPSHDPVVVTWETITGGVNVTMSGSYTLSSSCFIGAFTIETMETLFFPTSEDGKTLDCPTSGVIKVTGDQIAIIIFTPTGGMEIDNSNDGTVDETFESCDEADFCP